MLPYLASRRISETLKKPGLWINLCTAFNKFTSSPRATSRLNKPLKMKITYSPQSPEQAWSVYHSKFPWRVLQPSTINEGADVEPSATVLCTRKLDHSQPIHGFNCLLHMRGADDDTYFGALLAMQSQGLVGKDLRALAEAPRSTFIVKEAKPGHYRRTVMQNAILGGQKSFWRFEALSGGIYSRDRSNR